MPAGIPRPSTDENISTTLSSGITDVAGSMDVADASKIVSPCYLVIDRVDSAGTLKATSLWEYVKVTNVAGNTLTITRGQGGSTGQAHSSGAVVEAVVTSSMFEDWYAVLNPEHDSTGGHVIVGTMTVAGMNLLSVATIAVGAFNGIYVTNGFLNASGASLSGFNANVISGSSIFVSSVQNLKGIYLSQASVAAPEFGIVSQDGDLSINAGASKLVKFSTLEQVITSNTYRTNAVVLTGWNFITGDASNSNYTKAVSFGVPFTSVPVVFCAALGSKTASDPTAIGDFNAGPVASPTWISPIGPDTITTTGFTTNFHFNAALASGTRQGFSWVAIGQR